MRYIFKVQHNSSNMITTTEGQDLREAVAFLAWDLLCAGIEDFRIEEYKVDTWEQYITFDEGLL